MQAVDFSAEFIREDDDEALSQTWCLIANGQETRVRIKIKSLEEFVPGEPFEVGHVVDDKLVLYRRYETLTAAKIGALALYSEQRKGKQCTRMSVSGSP